jgi:hypothetical protein
MEKKYIIYGLIVMVILIAAFLIYKSQGLKRTYAKEVEKGLGRSVAAEKGILTVDDIKHLPEPVQKYLTYVGVIGKEKVRNLRAVVKGEMHMDPEKPWVKIRAEQYNFFDSQPTRLFYMTAKMFGIPAFGLHSYTDESAYMHIKAAGLFTVLNARGPEMRLGDTTTLFNDMCFFAPATLIDKRIRWEPVDSLSVKATFENLGTKISAMLYFNEKGELIDFVSNDRYYMPLDGSCRKAIWSTPISGYKEMNGFRLPTYGEAVWKFPEGDYCYAKFTNIQKIEYNVEKYK